jgi:hypothetical protein
LDIGSLAVAVVPVLITGDLLCCVAVALMAGHGALLKATYPRPITWGYLVVMTDARLSQIHWRKPCRAAKKQHASPSGKITQGSPPAVILRTVVVGVVCAGCPVGQPRLLPVDLTHLHHPGEPPQPHGPGSNPWDSSVFRVLPGWLLSDPNSPTDCGCPFWAQCWWSFHRSDPWPVDSSESQLSGGITAVLSRTVCSAV